MSVTIGGVLPFMASGKLLFLVASYPMPYVIGP